jgi:hypothetical protein
MSDQQMQFADPDWKPSQQLNTNNNPQEQEVYTPQPINSDYREQNKWGSAPSALPQQEGYTGLRPYAGPVPGQMQGGNYRQRPYSRRGRGPWFWIILAFIVISLISGGSRFGNGFGNGPGFDRNPVEQKQMMGNPIDYTVNGQATIVINDPNGNVTVTQGQSNTDVIIQPVNGNSFPGNPNNLPLTSNQSPDGKTINVNAQDSGQGPLDLNVTVPENANLNLTIDTGSINFNGTFDSTGTYKFQTTNGDITITVPSSSAFKLNASTNSGSINSDFPNVNVQDNTSGSGQNVNSVVGGSSQSQLANVVITSISGDINLNQK